MTREEMEQLTIAEMAAHFAKLRDIISDFKEQQSGFQKEFDVLRKDIIPAKLDEMGLDGAPITGIGRISLRAEVYASIVKDQKDEAYAWLAEHGHGALIKDTVNASSLKAWMKEQLANGEELPEEIFNCVPYTMATLTKN